MPREPIKSRVLSLAERARARERLAAERRRRAEVKATKVAAYDKLVKAAVGPMRARTAQAREKARIDSIARKFAQGLSERNVQARNRGRTRVLSNERVPTTELPKARVPTVELLRARAPTVALERHAEMQSALSSAVEGFIEGKRGPMEPKVPFVERPKVEQVKFYEKLLSSAEGVMKKHQEHAIFESEVNAEAMDFHDSEEGRDLNFNEVRANFHEQRGVPESRNRFNEHMRGIMTEARDTLGTKEYESFFGELGFANDKGRIKSPEAMNSEDLGKVGEVHFRRLLDHRIEPAINELKGPVKEEAPAKSTSFDLAEHIARQKAASAALSAKISAERAKVTN